MSVKCPVCNGNIKVEFVVDNIEVFEILEDGSITCVKDKQNGGTYVYCSNNDKHNVDSVVSEAIELCEDER